MKTFGHKDVVARIERKCTWCREIIKAGEAYHRYAFCFEDISPEFGTCEIHMECNTAGDDVDWYEMDHGFEAGEFYRGSNISKNEMTREEYENELAGAT